MLTQLIITYLRTDLSGKKMYKRTNMPIKDKEHLKNSDTFSSEVFALYLRSCEISDPRYI